MKLLVVVTFFAIISSNAYSQIVDSLQTTMSYQHKTNTLLDRLVRELDLSDKQSKSIKPILELRFQALSNKSINRVSQIESENAKTYAKLEKALTKEQMEKLHKLREERKILKAKFYQDNPTIKPSDEDLELDF